MPNTIEQRAFNLEVREALDSDFTIRGYAVVWDSWAKIGGKFFERVSPGAFTETLQRDDQLALWNHSDQYPLGRKSSGSLNLIQDKHGLHSEIKLNPKISFHRDVFESVRSGVIRGMSFRFAVDENGEELTRDSSNDLRRTIKTATLFEVSPVTFPAYEQTTIDTRAAQEYLQRMADRIPAAVPRAYIELPPRPEEAPERRAIRLESEFLEIYADTLR